MLLVRTELADKVIGLRAIRCRPQTVGVVARAILAGFRLILQPVVQHSPVFRYRWETMPSIRTVICKNLEHMSLLAANFQFIIHGPMSKCISHRGKTKLTRFTKNFKAVSNYDSCQNIYCPTNTIFGWTVNESARIPSWIDGPQILQFYFVGPTSLE